jgi:hypothetical protein
MESQKNHESTGKNQKSKEERPGLSNKPVLFLGLQSKNPIISHHESCTKIGLPGSENPECHK